MSPTLAAADRLVCRHTAFVWPFDTQSAAQIDAHWAAAARGNPKLYDGTVLLARNIARESGALAMDFFNVRFSRFLAWRDFGFPDQAVFNAFAMPALRSSDGAFLLGQMAPGHSLAGQLYFPAGTPDLSDLRDGMVDMEGSLLRELAEEAGIGVARADLPAGWTLVFHRQQIACMKIIDRPETAAEILARVRAHIAADPHPELAAAHMIRRRDELNDPRIPPFMTAFLAAVLPQG